MINMYVNHRKRACFVEEVYPHFVKAYYSIRGKVVDVTFNYGELVQAGYEPKGAL